MIVPVATLALGLANPAAAQAQDGWDMAVDPSRHLIAAGVQFDAGVGLTVQCEAGRLTLVLGGMPTTDDAIRGFVTTRGDGVSETTYWTTRSGSPLLTSDGARTVRFLRKGGSLTFASAPGEPRPSRMQIDLPTDPEGIDQVLTACGYPTEDPRDGIALVDEYLIRPPAVPMPESAFRKHGLFQVTISCLIADSRLSECRSDHEAPADPVIGAEVARSADGKPVRLTDAAAAEGRLLEIVVTSQGYGRDH
jgi:hypothetical protein